MNKVTLDPGKGGSNFGTVYGDLIEKNINLNIAIKCKEELLRHGILVEMTRDSDCYVGLSERAVKANNNDSDAFVSIHCNGGSGARGELVYSINNARGLNLAYKISNEIRNIGQRAIKIYNRLGHGFVDYNAVVREVKMESIIIKCAFVNNDTDNQLINTVEKQEVYGIAIAKGILEHFSVEYKD